MFDRIASSPDVLGGKPIIKGTRLSVEFILELIGSGGSVADIVRQYPVLSEHDVRQAALFASKHLKKEIDSSADVA
jgi:uncharacterized protein (DUF433 family)